MVQKLVTGIQLMRQKMRNRKVAHYWRKRALVISYGQNLYADILDCYPTALYREQHQLVRLRLAIPLQDDLKIEVLSYTFLVGMVQQWQGRRVRIRFLSGDLSLVEVQ